MLRTILFLAAVFSPAFAFAGEPAVFTIRTLRGQMRYDVTELTVDPVPR